MTTAKKWFYDAQAEADKQLKLNFGDCKCTYQVITKDRVLEQHSTPNGSSVMVLINKAGHNVSLFIYKMETFISKHVN